MKRNITITLFFAIIVLTPHLGFSWSGGKKFIDDVEIYTIYIDSDYVFCGTNTDWGTNPQYGVFVFDRRTKCWNNYSEANTGITNDIMAIHKVDSFVDVLAGIGTLRFKLPSLDYKVIDPMVGHRHLRRWFFTDSLVVGNRVYTTALDSVIVKEGDSRVATLVFKRPLDYDAYGSGQMVTDCFLYDSSIILTTATRVYEANVAPASGFLEFSPQDLSVKPWAKIKLSGKPLALLCAEQDEKEFWIGTNRGVYCIDKKTGRKTHYNITKGIVVAETLLVHSDQREKPPIIYEYHRGDSVKILGEQEFKIEIELPATFTGYLSEDYVKKEIDSPKRGRIVKIKDMNDLKDWGYVIVIKDSADWNSETVAEFHYYYVPNKEFVFSSKLDNWYHVTIPNTGWVPMKGLIFHLDKVED